MLKLVLFEAALKPWWIQIIETSKNMKGNIDSKQQQWIYDFYGVLLIK